MNLNNSNHLNISFPQWQGSGPSNVLYHGARVLENYLHHLKFHAVPVPESETLIQTITSVSKLFNIVGLGITEFVPDTEDKNKGLSQIKSIADLFI